MNVNYILEENYIKLNEQQISIGDTFNEIEAKANLSLFVSQENNESTIVSEDDFQLYFRQNVLYMWTLSPEDSFFLVNSIEIKLYKMNFNDFLEILYNKDLKWEFNKTYTFSDQVCIRLENKVDFIFGFDDAHRKGYLGKIGCFYKEL